ncbi:ATP-dependent Clp protease ATP-binding subunit clpA-like protein CD4B, chloroplastic [Triticum urartu]|uniref:ATP-dependent Clp protease ATP-binding subunit clpA-like protein CD4B, chloroplastic n=1 Tax=Triticum urartu TaxID=4572 RepID=M7Z778_TRIUA|nr:ATP-dependent Clp protease ATP-binding subunit clpA-like protein CD4B, chloroplastic [Triticum urartu]
MAVPSGMEQRGFTAGRVLMDERRMAVLSRVMAASTTARPGKVWDNLLLTMAGTLVLPVALETTFAGRTGGRHCKSHGTRRTPSMLAMSLNRPVRMAAFVGLRSVHSFSAVRSSNFRSTVASYRFSRRGRRASFVTRAMFERFTEKAIKVIMLAQEEARRLGHNFVGTEQVLLGLVGEGTGIAAKVLKSMGINLKDARVEVEKIIGRGNGFVAVEIPFTPRAKRVLELSLEEARQLGYCQTN